MKIAVAQIKPTKGNIPANIVKHITLVKKAVSLKANAVFFPELSLTGYEPKLSKELASNQNDNRLDMFQKFSDENSISIGLGLPAESDTGIRISMVIFQSHQLRETYSKQQLHSYELPYFVSGEEQFVLTIEGTKVAPAICYESFQPDHLQHAVGLGGEMYIASVAKPITGMQKAQKYFPEVARKYSIPVLLSNSLGYCDNFMSCGKSSIWNKDGELIGQLDTENEGILVFDTETNKTEKKYLEL